MVHIRRLRQVGMAKITRFAAVSMRMPGSDAVGSPQRKSDGLGETTSIPGERPAFKFRRWSNRRHKGQG